MVRWSELLFGQLRLEDQSALGGPACATAGCFESWYRASGCAILAGESRHGAGSREIAMLPTKDGVHCGPNLAAMHAQL